MSSARSNIGSTAGSVDHLIDGRRATGGSRSGPIYNPADGARIREVRLADRDTVEQALTAAERAFADWRNVPPLKRARVMFRFKELLERNEDRIVRLLTEEHGKVLDDARGEFMRGLENVEYACGAPELLKGEHSKNAGPAIDTWSEKQPLGVVAGVTPFNFPVMVPLWMYPIALVCGNTFVLKPSERDPSSAVAAAELLADAGLPDGVFNLVNGDREAVDALLEDTRVKAVSFVGSTAVAEHIYTTGTANGKRVQALGGAKNHAIVMPDADLDNAASALMGAAYGSCGERCMAISVVVAIGDETADALVAKLAPQIRALRIGPGLEQYEMGPLVTADHYRRVRSYVDLGVTEGAELVVDGRGLVVPGHEQGFFLGGCLFDRVIPGMTIHREEIFGPVLCVVRAAGMQQAMEIIDAHDYGNGACIFTRDGEAARYFSDNVKAGMVGINVPLPVPMAFHSFGGWKRSIFGTLHAYGPDAVRFYTNRKTVTQRWPAGGIRERSQFFFPSNR